MSSINWRYNLKYKKCSYRIHSTACAVAPTFIATNKHRCSTITLAYCYILSHSHCIHTLKSLKEIGTVMSGSFTLFVFESKPHIHMTNESVRHESHVDQFDGKHKRLATKRVLRIEWSTMHEKNVSVFFFSFWYCRQRELNLANMALFCIVMLWRAMDTSNTKLLLNWMKSPYIFIGLRVNVHCIYLQKSFPHLVSLINKIKNKQKMKIRNSCSNSPTASHHHSNCCMHYEHCCACRLENVRLPNFLFHFHHQSKYRIIIIRR